MAITFNLSIEQGTDFERTFTVKANNVAANITGFSISGKMKRISSGVDSPTIPFVITITNAATGKAKMELSNITTDLLVPGRYAYDVEMTNTSGKIFRIVEGNVTVKPSVTK